MRTNQEIINRIKNGKSHSYEKRGAGGTKLLTLSWQPTKGFRFFTGARPGGGGVKHTRCTEARAMELLTKVGGVPGAEIFGR